MTYMLNVYHMFLPLAKMVQSARFNNTLCIDLFIYLSVCVMYESMCDQNGEYKSIVGPLGVCASANTLFGRRFNKCRLLTYPEDTPNIHKYKHLSPSMDGFKISPRASGRWSQVSSVHVLRSSNSQN